MSELMAEEIALLTNKHRWWHGKDVGELATMCEQLAEVILDRPAPTGELGKALKNARTYRKNGRSERAMMARNLIALHAEHERLKAELAALKDKFHHKNCKGCINFEEIEKWSTGKMPECCLPCHKGELAGIIFHPGWRPLPELLEQADD